MIGLTVEVVRTGDGAAIAVTGELDVASCHEFDRRTTEVLAATSGAITCDLGSMTFLDSSGARSLLILNRRLGELGRKFIVVCPRTNTAVWLVFNLLRVTETLEVVEVMAGDIAG